MIACSKVHRRTLGHLGVLFLEKASEWGAAMVDALRTPLNRGGRGPVDTAPAIRSCPSRSAGGAVAAGHRVKRLGLAGDEPDVHLHPLRDSRPHRVLVPVQVQRQRLAVVGEAEL
jgi:hypothetical protein